MLIKAPHNEIEEVNFWPADEIEAVFKRVNAAMGTPGEIEEMRLFVRVMNYFYEQADTGKGEMSEDQMNELYRLAKIGLNKELGITEPEEQTV